MKAPSPLLGFNNNVRHKGRVFHIQTEDSGIRHPHIITHLFADGGRIIKSHKRIYAEHVSRQDVALFVRGLMKEAVRQSVVERRDLTDRLDAVLTDRWLGIPIFVAAAGTDPRFAKLVHRYLFSAALWLLLGTAVGLLEAFRLVDPTLLDSFSFLHYGRVRPLVFQTAL